MLASYRPLFEVPGARVFITGGFDRPPAGSMFAVSVVAMVAARTGSYALAGAVVAVGMVSLALFAPILGRLVDRYGQRRIAIPFFLWSGFWAVMTLLTSLRGWPSWLLFITFPLCGAIPNLGTMARARWSHIFARRPEEPARGHVVRAGHGGGHLRHRPGPRDLAVDDALPRGRFRLRDRRLHRRRPRLHLGALHGAARRPAPRAPDRARVHRAGARPARLHHGDDGRDLRRQRGRHARRLAGPGRAERGGRHPRAVCRGVGLRRPRLRSRLARRSLVKLARRRHARHGGARGAGALRRPTSGSSPASCWSPAWRPRRPSSRR